MACCNPEFIPRMPRSDPLHPEGVHSGYFIATASVLSGNPALRQNAAKRGSLR